MNRLVIKFLILSISFIVIFGECPKPETIYPCRCSISSLYCEGHEVKDLGSILKGKLKSSHGESVLKMAALNINNTLITSIDSETFSGVTFEAIFIRNNLKLTSIDPNAFSKSAEVKSVQVFDLFDSPNYVNSEQIFAIFENLGVNQKIGLGNLGITEIPDNAFKSKSKLGYLIASNNAIKRIGKSAFSGLTNLFQLILVHNNISEIDSNGLTFDLTNNERNDDVTVILNYNKLTERSFHENWSDSKLGNRKLSLLINANNITTLPENIFKSVLLSPSTKILQVGGNPLVCDCKMKYLFTIKSSIKDNLSSAECHNLQNKTNVLNLDEKDLSQC